MFEDNFLDAGCNSHNMIISVNEFTYQFSLKWNKSQSLAFNLPQAVRKYLTIMIHLCSTDYCYITVHENLLFQYHLAYNQAGNSARDQGNLKIILQYSCND